MLIFRYRFLGKIFRAYNYFMGKQFNQNNNRGGPPQRGGWGRGRPQMDQGPPTFVIPYGTYLHRSQNHFVLKCSDPSRVPKFNRGVYLQNKAKVGTVDQILGCIDSFYFSVKPADGIKPDSFKKDQVFHMNPQDLLPIERWTRPQQRGPKPQGPRPGGGGKPGFQKNFGGKPQGGGFKGGRPGGAKPFTKPIHKR